MDYYKNSRISQSKIKLFLESKEKYYYRYVSSDYEPTDKEHLGFGRYYHTMVLQPELLKDKYVINNGLKVDGMMGIFIEEFYKAHSVHGLPQELAKEDAYKKSGFKWDIEKVWEKFAKDPDNVLYYKYLKTTAGKEIIKQEDNTKAIKMLNRLTSNKTVLELLGNPQDPNIVIYNELEIDWEVGYTRLKLKSMLDRVVINKSTKTITILDLKTTKCSNLKSFKYDMINYKYYIQAIFYINALEYLIDNDIDWIDYRGYKIDFIFIPQYTEAPYHVLRPIRLTKASLDKGYEEYREALQVLEACMNTDIWESDDEYSDTSGVVTLKLFNNE